MTGSMKTLNHKGTLLLTGTVKPGESDYKVGQRFGLQAYVPMEAAGHNTQVGCSISNGGCRTQHSSGMFTSCIPMEAAGLNTQVGCSISNGGCRTQHSSGMFNFTESSII